MIVVMRMTADLTCINIQSVLAFLGKTAQKNEKNAKTKKGELCYGLCLLYHASHVELAEFNVSTYLMLNVTMSSRTLCVTYFDSFFSSMPFLCSVAMKSVNALDIRNCSSMIRPANMSGPCFVC